MDDLWEDFNAAETAETERHATELAEDFATEALFEMVGEVFEIDRETATLVLARDGSIRVAGHCPEADAPVRL